MIQFPANPIPGDIFSPFAGVTYKWNGQGWAPFGNVLTKDEAASTYMPLAQRGTANGVATLDATTKVPVAQLHAGEVNGIASLDATGKMPAAQLPDAALTEAEAAATYIPLTYRATPNGVATLDSGGQVPQAQYLKTNSGGGKEFLINTAILSNYGTWSGLRIDEPGSGSFIDLLQNNTRYGTLYAGPGYGLNISAPSGGVFSFGIGNPGNYQISPSDLLMTGPDGPMASQNFAVAMAIALG